MVPAAWSIPFPARDARKKKRAKQADCRRPGRNSQQKTPPPLPPWDGTITDQSRFKLTAAETTFRQSLRQGRHRQLPAASAAARQDPTLGLLHPPLEAHRESAASIVGSWLDGGNEGSAGYDRQGDSLEAMRRFVKELQRKHGLGGSAAAAPPTAAHGNSEECRQLAAAGRIHTTKHKKADGDSDTESSSWEDEKEDEAVAVSVSAASTAKPPPTGMADHSTAGSESEGEGHLGPAALRRMQQRLAAASPQHTQAACANERHCHEAKLGQGVRPARCPEQHQQHERSLLDRLAAAEAQLGRVDGLVEQLRESRAAVAALQEQSANLRAELDACISHSLHATTQLQAQLSRVLATQGPDAGSKKQQQKDWTASSSPAPLTPAVSVAVGQARAAAEALFVAQQAQQVGLQVGAGKSVRCPALSSAQGAAEVQAPQQKQAGEGRDPLAPAGKQQPSAHRDVLASVQLPSFKHFAELRRAAACKLTNKSAADEPHTEHTALPQTQPLPGHASGDAGRLGGQAGEDMPHPRSLPQSLLQQLGVQGDVQLATERHAAGEQGFQWRPLNPAVS